MVYLKERREELGYTQKQVGEAVGVSQVAVAHWENGTFKPSAANLIELAKFLHCSVDLLLGTEEPSKTPTS